MTELIHMTQEELDAFEEKHGLKRTKEEKREHYDALNDRMEPLWNDASDAFEALHTTVEKEIEGVPLVSTYPEVTLVGFNAIDAINKAVMSTMIKNMAGKMTRDEAQNEIEAVTADRVMIAVLLGYRLGSEGYQFEKSTHVHSCHDGCKIPGVIVPRPESNGMQAAQEQADAPGMYL